MSSFCGCVCVIFLRSKCFWNCFGQRRGCNQSKALNTNAQRVLHPRQPEKSGSEEEAADRHSDTASQIPCVSTSVYDLKVLRLLGGF